MTPRIASLGMYDRPELHAPNDRLWTAIAGHLRRAGLAGVPDSLDRSRPLHEIWADPALLFAQCCGYPMTMSFSGHIRYLATPVYRATGCDGVQHRSRLIARHDDERDALSAFRGSRAALNQRDSNTGMNLLRAAIARLAPGPRFFAEVIETGSHAESARRIAAGHADIAAVDTVSYAYLDRYEPEVTARLKTIGWTDLSPGLPFVTATSTSQADSAALVRTLRAAIDDPDLAIDRNLLLLDDIRQIGASRYAVVQSAERRAVRSGYPELV